ncbi:MAG TPA: DoxX family protein [Ktedonobacteraceae bacterium]|nr:DoxX family protein [Ktedonobacteraceae bacterium]
MSIAKSLGHLLLSGIFISGGAQAFMEPGGRVNKVAEAGFPKPKQAIEFNGAVMVIGGILLASGIAPKLAATMLIGSLVPTTIVGHAFWKEENTTGRKNQLTQFYKNLGLLGGLLLVLSEK